MTNSIPERWLEYKAYGDAIKGTKLLAFKVPLKEGIVSNLDPVQRFTPKILLQAFPRLKYVVDLTNTGRYYDKKIFTDAGVKYEKVMIPGKKLPPIDSVKRFFKIIDDWTSSCGEDELIGVHCTHGVNRTGYLICRYLIQQLGWGVQDAIKAFEDARGYPIEREAYLTALKETPRGKKIDTSKVSLTSSQTTTIAASMKTVKRSASSRYPMRPPGFVPPRRGFANDGPFPPQPHFGFGGPPPGFGPMPPPPGMPPIPPPPGPPMYGPRPHRYGPPIRPAMPPPPPGPGFPSPGFSPRMPGPLRMAGPSRLPPPARLPPPKMPPPPPQVRSVVMKQLQVHKKKQHMRNGIVMPASDPLRLVRRDVSNRGLSKVLKEQDFTVDTFEENLLTASTTGPQRRTTKGRFNQTK